MRQVLAAACRLHPAKAEGCHHAGSLGREWEGSSGWKEGKMQRSGQPISKATCSLPGLHLLLRLCYWSCRGQVCVSYKTVVGTARALPIGAKFPIDNREILGLFPAVIVQEHAWKVTHTMSSTRWKQTEQDGGNGMFSRQPTDTSPLYAQLDKDHGRVHSTRCFIWGWEIKIKLSKGIYTDTWTIAGSLLCDSCIKFYLNRLREKFWQWNDFPIVMTMDETQW